MKPILGNIVVFNEYLTKTKRMRTPPVIWKGTDLEEALQGAHHEQRGSFALVDPNAVEPGTLTPGLSFTIQVILPGEKTTVHQHSFWHLYIVREGCGVALLSDEGEHCDLKTGDILLVPAWCPHQFVNNMTGTSLTLLVLQNLPQQAVLGSLVRQEENLEKTVIYQES